MLLNKDATTLTAYFAVGVVASLFNERLRLKTRFGKIAEIKNATTLTAYFAVGVTGLPYLMSVCVSKHVSAKLELCLININLINIGLWLLNSLLSKHKVTRTNTLVESCSAKQASIK
ncbi:hypothetical protein ABTQ33_11760 [Paucilactobacillus suebicus]|uniref:hypothetical protein n=1 Tax=Paucilactobacillus suebicus TaxID=152335 RepID=UPI0002490958|nr:hypothetical protein [Paucilactobacillus suebicus]